MHKLLVDIFEEHPGKTVYLSLHRLPRVVFDGSTKAVTNGLDEPLTPATLAEIINSLITDKEGATLKKKYFVATEIRDGRYLRNIAIQYDDKSIDVRIISTPVHNSTPDHKKADEMATTLRLIKG